MTKENNLGSELSIEEKKHLLEIIKKSYWYRLYAIVFCVGGLVIFGYIYFNHIQKDLLSSLQNPLTALSVLIPFLPGAFLAYRAEKLQTKARSLLKKHKA